jgi:hypothetical protein
MAKTQVTFKLSESVIKELKALSARYGVSQAALISILISSLYSGWDEEHIETALDLAAKL